LLKIGGVESVSFTEQDPFQTSNRNSNVTWEGKDDNSTTFFNVIQVGEDFTETFEIELKRGEGFLENYSDDNQKQFLINQAAAEAIDAEELLGMTLQVWGHKGIVKGVVRNYNHQSLEESIEPVIIVFNPKETWTAYIGLNTDHIQHTVNEIETVYKNFESEYPFDYSFVDERFQATYNDIINVGKISNIFSTVAIIISCLGLFGLSAFIIEQKRMETGIRKVLGANQISLIYLFTVDFIKLVFYSFLVAAPVSWIYTNHWLSGFAFHTDIGSAPFVIAGIASLAIALITVGYNTIRAGGVNPVELLKDE
jgi:ABC-type antimicrobial peptide transport system permease subunit